MPLTIRGNSGKLPNKFWLKAQKEVMKDGGDRILREMQVQERDERYSEGDDEE